VALPFGLQIVQKHPVALLTLRAACCLAPTARAIALKGISEVRGVLRPLPPIHQ